jgi:hypothetical protein
VDWDRWHCRWCIVAGISVLGIAAVGRIVASSTRLNTRGDRSGIEEHGICRWNVRVRFRLYVAVALGNVVALSSYASPRLLTVLGHDVTGARGRHFHAPCLDLLLPTSSLLVYISEIAKSSGSRY